MARHKKEWADVDRQFGCRSKNKTVNQKILYWYSIPQHRQKDAI